MSAPSVTVAVCTRDRPAVVGAAVASVLAGAPADAEVLVIDQSDGDATERALQALRADPRLRYLRSAERGLARGRNQALALAHAEVVAFTDDDCDVPEGWAVAMRELVLADPRIALAYCNVLPGPHDPAAGFVPSYRRRGTALVTGVLAKCRARGIGAGMAVRRSAALALGGFDALLGAGGPLRSAEEYDLAARAILAGHAVYETDAVAVVHHGFRTWAEGRELTVRDWTGIGAAYSKPLRAGHLRFAVVPLYELAVNVLWPPLWDLLRLRRPGGLKRLAGFARGFARGWRTPLDRRTLRFVAPAPAGAAGPDPAPAG